MWFHSEGVTIDFWNEECNFIAGVDLPSGLPIYCNPWYKRTKSVWSVSSTLVGEVQNLTATLQPNHDSESETFVVLQWDAPSKDTEDKITAYDIRFRPDGEDAYCEESVDGSSRIILLTKSSGIKTLTTYNFEVRARIEVAEGRWKAVSQYIGTWT